MGLVPFHPGGLPGPNRTTCPGTYGPTGLRFRAVRPFPLAAMRRLDGPALRPHLVTSAHLRSAGRTRRSSLVIIGQVPAARQVLRPLRTLPWLPVELRFPELGTLCADGKTRSRGFDEIPMLSPIFLPTSPASSGLSTGNPQTTGRPGGCGAAGGPVRGRCGRCGGCGSAGDRAPVAVHPAQPPPADRDAARPQHAAVHQGPQDRGGGLVPEGHPGRAGVHGPPGRPGR